MADELEDPVTLVCAALLTDDNLGNAVIEVKEKDGMILLKGRVETKRESIAVAQVARQQAGEMQVINQLKINR